MSTYFPKTFRKWKVQKKCLSCSQEPLKYIQKEQNKQLTIHSMAIDKQLLANSPQLKPFSQIYQIDSPQLKRPSTPSGGRKKKRSPSKSNFHRTSWEDIRLISKGSIKQTQKQQKGIANNNMFRMITKKRPPINEMKKRLTQRSALEDLIKLVSPSKKYENQILQTDQQRKSVGILQKDQFIPYRVKNDDKKVRIQPQTIQPHFITSPRTQQKKENSKFCDFSDAMTKIPIGKSSRYKSQKKMGDKIRSFSVVQLETSKSFIKNRGNSNINIYSSMQIKPWEQTQQQNQ